MYQQGKTEPQSKRGKKKRKKKRKKRKRKTLAMGVEFRQGVELRQR